MNAIGGMAVGERGEGLGQPFVGIDAAQLAVLDERGDDRPYCALTNAAKASGPLRKSTGRVEPEQPARFGYSLGEISDAPMSIGLSAGLRSWPRLSTETDDRVRGFFASMREARRARQEREFRAFQARLLAGHVPEKEINDLLARYEKRRGG